MKSPASCGASTLIQDIEEELCRLQKLGLVFKDVVELEPITTYDELKNALSDLGLAGVSDETMLNSLFNTRHLMEEFQKKKKVNPFTKQRRKASQSVAAMLQLLHVRTHVFLQKAEVVPYQDLLARLRAANDFDVDFHYQFYLKLTATDNLLEDALYPQDKNRHPDLKRSDLVVILSALKRTPLNARQRRALGEAEAIERDLYPCDLQPQSWFDELNYKLYRLYKRFDSLAADKQSEMISYLLHGARHCCDAKWHAINDAYERFCNDDAKLLSNEYLESANSAALLPRINAKISFLKVKNLSKYIYTVINDFNLHEESSTFFNATWDCLGPLFGLSALGSAYPKYAIMQAYARILYRYRELLPAAEVYKATASLIAGHLDKQHFGVLSQLIADKDELVIAVLRYYDILH